MTVEYWAKFERMPQPIRIVADTWPGLKETLDRLTTMYGILEWLIR